MMQSIASYRTSAAIALLLFFGLAMQTFAYDNLEIEIEFEDGIVEVDVDYDEDGAEVELSLSYETDDLDEVYGLVADELDLTADEVKAATSEIEYEDEDEREEDEKVTEEDAQDALDDAQSEIDEASEEIAEAVENDNETELSETALDDAKSLLEEAQAAFEQSDYAEAETLAEQAEDLASKAHMKYLDKTADEVSDLRPAACEKKIPGKARGLRALCEDTRPSESIKERREARCEEAALDGEVNRADYFCRGGEWREKRKARLDDLLAGFIDAGDLDDEQATAIREEMIDLIRQLIVRLMGSRLGS